MAKKHNEVAIPEEPAVVSFEESEPLFEAEAYGTPQPEAGSDVTVMKQVGVGGPVPIVAPKHNTIQLQPIIVPLAVVPYMTQDSNVLRTDSRGAGVYESGDDGYREATEFSTVERTKSTKKKRKPMAARIFSLVTFLLSALVVLPFFLSNVVKDIGSMHITEFDVIMIFKVWIEAGFSVSGANAICLVYVILMFLTGVQVILALVGLIAGRYPKPIMPILSFISMAGFIGVLVYKIVSKNFVAGNEVGLLVLLVLSALGFVLSVIFSILLNHKEDKEEMNSKRGSEI